jgi:hypothetical protein
MLDFPNAPTTGQTFNNWTWDSAKWVGLGGPPYQPQLNNVGRNLLHNGLFNIAQRGAAFNPPSNGIPTLDRWLCSFSDDGVSVYQTTQADADRSAIGDEAAKFSYQVNYTGSAAATAFNVHSQRSEDVRRLGGKTISVSFYAKAFNTTPRVGISIDQNFGAGGSPQVAGTATAVTLSTTWQRYVLSFAVPSTSGKTIGTNNDSSTQLNFWLSAGANMNVRAGGIGVQTGTVYIWGVQLEVGSTATPLEKPDPQQDLAKCMRFYQSLTSLLVQGYAGSGNNIYNTLTLPVIMRAAPTVTQQTSGTPSNLTILSAAGAVDHLQTAGQMTATAYGFGAANYQLSADL